MFMKKEELECSVRVPGKASVLLVCGQPCPMWRFSGILIGTSKNIDLNRSVMDLNLAYFTKWADQDLFLTKIEAQPWTVVG